MQFLSLGQRRGREKSTSGRAWASTTTQDPHVNETDDARRSCYHKITADQIISIGGNEWPLRTTTTCRKFLAPSYRWIFHNLTDGEFASPSILTSMSWKNWPKSTFGSCRCFCMYRRLLGLR